MATEAATELNVLAWEITYFYEKIILIRLPIFFFFQKSKILSRQVPCLPHVSYSAVLIAQMPKNKEGVSIGFPMTVKENRPFIL